VKTAHGRPFAYLGSTGPQDPSRKNEQNSRREHVEGRHCYRHSSPQTIDPLTWNGSRRTQELFVVVLPLTIVVATFSLIIPSRWQPARKSPRDRRTPMRGWWGTMEWQTHWWQAPFTDLYGSGASLGSAVTRSQIGALTAIRPGRMRPMRQISVCKWLHTPGATVDSLRLRGSRHRPRSGYEHRGARSHFSLSYPWESSTSCGCCL
jgi:hypothetical protein